MINSLRKSGINMIGDVSWGTHFCQFYQTKEDLVDILVPYFKAGLENNELCVWVTSQSLETEDAKKSLRSSVPDLDTYLEKGQIEIIPHTCWYLKDDIFDSKRVLSSWVEKFNRGLSGSYDGVRISGDISWLEGEDWNHFVEYKKQIDNIIVNCRIIALCTCSLGRCNAAEIIDLAVNHQFALIRRKGEWEQIESSRRKKVEELAFQTVKEWEETFDTVPDLVMIIDNEYRIVRANRAIAARLGITPEKCIGLTCYHAVHGTNETPSFCPHKQLLKDGLEHTVEIQEDIPGGFFSVSVSPLYNTAGEIIGSIHIARDITDRKHIEESLRESEERFRSVLENSLNSAYRLDLQNNRFDYMSPVIEQITGFSAKEINAITRNGLLARIHPDDCPLIIAGIAKALDEGFGTHEYRFKCKDGKYRWLADHFSIIKDKTGMIRFRAGIVRDITEHKEAEEALRLSNIYNRSLIEASLDPLVTIGPDGKITDVNGATERVTGYSRYELVDTDFSNYFTDPEKARAGYQQAFTEGKIRDYPLEIQHKEGHIAPVLYNASVYKDESGKVIGVFAAARDITEIKKAEKALQVSEARYRSLYENSLDGIFLTNPDGTILSANPQACQMFGMTEDEIKHVGREGIVVNDEKLAAALEERRLTGRARAELTYRRKDGSTFVCDTTSQLFIDADGSTSTSLIIRDITERKQKEHRISRYNNVLAGINRIFSNVVQVKTEEELGNACLSVALEVTGSQFGFINEMGDDGLLHDIAKSELAWEQCFMSDKTGHRCPPSDFIVHGLYGSVVINEKSFFTNDPPSYPESIGLPQGHPSLTSFLGVPLVQDGKTVGLIAVANREGGYSSEQLEDLEAIAPAVTQALQRKRSEEALRLSNIYNRSLIEASLDPLVTIGPDGKITDVNGATELITGYSRNDLIGTDFSDYFTEPYKASKGYQQAFDQGEIRGYPLEIQHKNGHVIPVLYNASIYKDEAGKVIGVFAGARGITELKEAEKALKKAHDNLEKLVEERTAELGKAYESLKESEEGLAEAQRIAHVGNWDLDLVNDKGYWSDELYNIFGRSFQDPPPSYNELLNYIHPEDRDYVDKSIKKGFKEEPKSGIDYRIVLANGEERTVHSQAEVIFDEQKNPVRVKGIVQDITERKRIEDELESVARLPRENPDPVMRLSQGRIINYASPSAQVLLTDWGSAVSKEAPAEITEPSVAALGDGIRRKLECTYGNRTYMINIAPFPGAGYVNLYAHDITESKKAKEALEKIDRIRIKEIHHRIKNNLQVISSLLNLQAERFRNREVLEAFRESQDRITSMSLIHEELYKGEKNDKLNFSAYLQKLAESLFQTYSLKSKNVRLFTELEENIFFDMDVAVPLGIIVNELVSNSLKHAFTGEREGEIRVKLFREEKGNEMHKSLFSLTISDDGKGIPENIKLENLESLGLQLVNILVDQLDGKIELNRTHGTEFRITFNVAERS